MIGISKVDFYGRTLVDLTADTVDAHFVEAKREAEHGLRQDEEDVELAVEGHEAGLARGADRGNAGGDRERRGMKKRELETELLELKRHVDVLSEALLKSLATLYTDRDEIKKRLGEIETALKQIPSPEPESKLRRWL